MPDIATLSDLATVISLRDYHCPRCRVQVNRIAERPPNRRETAVVAGFRIARGQRLGRRDMTTVSTARPANPGRSATRDGGSACPGGFTTASAEEQRRCCWTCVSGHDPPPVTARSSRRSSVPPRGYATRPSSTADPSSADLARTSGGRCPTPRSDLPGLVCREAGHDSWMCPSSRSWSASCFS